MYQINSELIKASAGTGKTFKLAVRYIAYLLNDEHPSKLIASTFTKKAAGEILDRIYDLLVQIAKDNNRISQYQISKELAVTLLRKLSNSQQTIKILTLDSLFNQFFAFFSSNMMIPKNYRLVDEDENKKNKEKIVDELLQEFESDVALEVLGDYHGGNLPINFKREIVDYLEKNSEIYGIAYEGSWKQFDYCKSAKIEDVINKFEERFKLEFGTRADVKAKELQALKDRNYNYLFTRDRLFEIAKGLRTESQGKKPIDPGAVEVYQEIAQIMQNHATTIVNQKNKSLAKFFSMQREITRKFIKKTGLVSFYNIKELLAEESLLGKLDLLYFRLDSRINHIMLDEFQDTSILDWTIISPLVEEIISDPVRTTLVVGDQKQSIYGWRGGTPELFNYIEEAFGEKLTTHSMNESYRCSPVVLEFVNDFFAGLANTPLNQEYPKVVSEWKTKFEKQIAKKDIPGHVQLISAEEDLTIQAAEFIKKLIKEYPSGKIGVLARNNGDLDSLKAKLAHEDYKIPFSDDAGVAIDSNHIVKAILACFEYLDHPEKTVCRYIFLNSQLGKNILYENLPEYCIKIRKRIFNDGLVPTIRYMIKESGFLPDYETNFALESLYSIAGTYSFRSSRLSQFVEFVQNKRITNKASAQVNLMTIHKSKGLEFDIVVMPYFDSNLLEQRYVKLVSNQSSKQLQPSAFSIKGSMDISSVIPELDLLTRRTIERSYDEQLSVMYVAFTRAKHSLYIFGSFKEDKLTYSGIVKSAGCKDHYGNSDFTILNEDISNQIISYPDTVNIRTSNEWTRTLPVKNPSKEDQQSFFTTGLTRGTALHRILQDIIWWNGKNLSIYPKAYQNYTKELEHLLNKADFSFLKEQDCKVYNEFKFSIQIENSIMSGSVDRLMVYQDRIEIYDYKSDRDVISDELVRHYTEQLNSYEQALSRIFENLTIHKNLVFLEHAKVLTV